MTSASEAVKRLQSESLQQKSLNQLKQDAAELGLSKEDVKQFGNLTHKQTWLAAVESAVATHQKTAIATTEQNAIAQPEDLGDNAVQRNNKPSYGALLYKKVFTPEDIFNSCGDPELQAAIIAATSPQDNAVQRNTDDELPFKLTQTLIDGEWVETAEIVDPSQLPTLKQTDERFKDWEPWMIPGAIFSNSLGRYSILYFDKWGNCHCKELDTEREWWACYRISSLTGLSTPSTPIEPFTPSSELPPKLTELTAPIDVKENLLRRMAEHGTPPEEIEKLRHEPLDFCTAYLGDFLLTLADSFRELTA